MKVKVLVEKEIDIKIAKCQIDPSCFEDAIVNGENDTDEFEPNFKPKIPCAEKVSITNRYGKETMDWRWCPIINLDTGQILNWTKGTTAQTFYKVCDGVEITFIDDNEYIVTTYKGYVPKFLAPDNPGWFSGEDYLEMTIDENGYIKNFDGDLSDVFMDRKD